ncbi:MAG: alpha/beta hydrolase [Saprospiraceae bacterium]|nr:alpha/beta hydrolase [Saprospiraceae bacterium]
MGKESQISLTPTVKLFFREWTCEEPRVNILLSHGFGEHSGRYQHFGEFCNQNGINLFAYDHPGHGKTTGKAGHADSLDQLMDGIELVRDKIHKQVPQVPVVGYGHSMGGNILLNSFFRRETAFEGIIATGSWIHLADPAPAIKVKIGKLLRNLIPKMTQETNLDSALLCTDQQVGRDYDKDPLVQTRISNALGIDILKGAEYLENFSGQTAVPILLMHGAQDQIIDPRGTRELANKIKGDVELKIWEGMFHEIHNEPRGNEVFLFVLNWLKNKIFI